MNESLRRDAEKIARGAVAAVSPEAAVRRALNGKTFFGKLYLVSVGSDGTDGPTDAAGGYVDGNTARELASQSLLFTGPTGTNADDVAIAMIG